MQSLAESTPKSNRAPRNDRCRWNCGHPTKNHNGICDSCWQAAELLRSSSDEGYRAWLEKKKADMAIVAAANPKRQAAGRKGRKPNRSELAEFELESLASALSEL